MEVWVKIKNWPYLVSNGGQVMRATSRTRGKAGKLLKPFVYHSGYKLVDLCCNGKVKRFPVHRLVCAAFNGPPPTAKHHAAHLNGVPTDCRATNLRWCTPKENSAHMLTHGTRLMGETHPLSKLSNGDVLEIRELFKCGVRQTEIASKYSITKECVHRIVHRVNWRHLS